MQLELKHIGKKFQRDWIFKDVNLLLEQNSITGITGPNGSGKSTLLQCVSGFVMPSEGSVTLFKDEKAIPDEELYRQVSIAAPYLDQHDWLTLRETIALQKKFKPFRNGLSDGDVIEKTGLQHAADKFLKQFSSGMRQRVKLALAMLADTSVLLLDEPTSNLDNQGINWFDTLLQSESHDRIVVICSNSQQTELMRAGRRIDIAAFKVNT
ncbi:MAG: ABC transporter ATP-binding protein [Cryomorphaceae bacterium]|nr:MAG: ABC transporter ATP-binding protein [Cryomorphaceae bacterium]